MGNPESFLTEPGVANAVEYMMEEIALSGGINTTNQKVLSGIFESERPKTPDILDETYINEFGWAVDTAKAFAKQLLEVRGLREYQG